MSSEYNISCLSTRCPTRLYRALQTHALCGLLAYVMPLPQLAVPMYVYVRAYVRIAYARLRKRPITDRGYLLFSYSAYCMIFMHQLEQVVQID